MSAARVIPHHQRDGRAVAYDAVKFISDERLVAVAKMGDGTVFDELHRRHAERCATKEAFANKENDEKISEGLLGTGTQMPSPSPDPFSG